MCEVEDDPLFFLRLFRDPCDDDFEASSFDVSVASAPFDDPLIASRDSGTDDSFGKAEFETSEAVVPFDDVLFLLRLLRDLCDEVPDVEVVVATDSGTDDNLGELSEPVVPFDDVLFLLRLFRAFCDASSAGTGFEAFDAAAPFNIPLGLIPDPAGDNILGETEPDVTFAATSFDDPLRPPDPWTDDAFGDAEPEVPFAAATFDGPLCPPDP